MRPGSIPVPNETIFGELTKSFSAGPTFCNRPLRRSRRRDLSTPEIGQASGQGLMAGQAAQVVRCQNVVDCLRGSITTTKHLFCPRLSP
jgi:hypothetical protein